MATIGRVVIIMHVQYNNIILKRMAIADFNCQLLFLAGPTISRSAFGYVRLHRHLYLLVNVPRMPSP